MPSLAATCARPLCLAARRPRKVQLLLLLAVHYSVLLLLPSRAACLSTHSKRLLEYEKAVASKVAGSAKARRKLVEAGGGIVLSNENSEEWDKHAELTTDKDYSSQEWGAAELQEWACGNSVWSHCDASLTARLASSTVTDHSRFALPTEGAGDEAEETTVGAFSTNHFMSDRTLAPGPEDSSGPFLVGSTEFVWGAQITPHPECACHGRSFLWDGGRGDCFSPWTTTIRPRCAEVCLCQDVLGSGSGPDMQYDAAAKVCTNGTAASQVEACGVAQRCEDDDSYADSDGDDCLFYASYPNPSVACNHPGYTEALTRCPVACGTCAALGLDPAAQSPYVRFYDAQPGVRSQCKGRDDLKIRSASDTIRYDTIGQPGTGSTVICAKQCYRNADCKSFSVNLLPEAEGGAYCEFSTGCQDLDELAEDAHWDTYIVSPSSSSCDPQPMSPLTLDSCGVCGGDNSTCLAVIELVTEHRSTVMALPSLGSQIAIADCRGKAGCNNRFMRAATAQPPDYRGPPPAPPAQDCATLATVAATKQCQEYQAATETLKVAEALKALTDAKGLVHRGAELDADSAVTSLYAFLSLTGAHGNLDSMRGGVGNAELMLAFAPHDGGDRVEFELNYPSAEALGDIHQLKFRLAGGNHFLSTSAKAGVGRVLTGVNLRLTISLQRWEWRFRLDEAVQIDGAREETVSFDWSTHNSPTGERLSIIRCRLECLEEAGPARRNGFGSSQEKGEWPLKPDSCERKCSSSRML